MFSASAKIFAEFEERFEPASYYWTERERRWRRAVAGLTREDFSQLVVQYERLVYTICFQLTRDAAVSEDLTQETFLSAYLHRETMPAGYERQWLGRIAANKAKDHLQSAWKRRTVLPGDEALPPGEAPAAEELALEKSGAAEIRSAIEGLREPYGQVCRLCLLEERTPEEAALALGRPIKTVHTQLARGKGLLRRKLTERSEGYDGIPQRRTSDRGGPGGAGPGR